MTRTRGLLTGVALAVMLAACTDGQAATTTTAVAEAMAPGAVASDGRDVDTSRLIPLNGDIAEIVWALGLGDRVVATDVSATYPDDADDAPKIGYQRTLNAEGILSFEPTLVIGNELAGPPETLEQIADAGVNVIVLPELTGIDQVGEKIRGVADAVGASEMGEELAAEVEAEIEEVTSLVADLGDPPRVAFIYARGPNTVLLGGKGTASGAMIEAAGAVDVGVETGVDDYVPLTPEAITAADPDVIVMLDAGLESLGGLEGLAEVPGLAQTTAVAEGRVLTFDDLYFLGLGPRTGAALRELAEALHPELAP